MKLNGGYALKTYNGVDRSYWNLFCVHYQSVLVEELSKITEYFKHNNQYPSLDLNRVPSDHAEEILTIKPRYSIHFIYTA
jgi:hypothetical protein